jgi:protein-tyrosine phosphatase
MEALLNRGVTTFVDLTQPHWENLDIYARDLRHANGALRPVRLHYPIRDASAPSRELLCEILDAIDVALLNGETVYVHCRSGVGRTGTVLGAHLVRHGMRGDDALHRLARVANGPAFGGVS